MSEKDKDVSRAGRRDGKAGRQTAQDPEAQETKA